VILLLSNWRQEDDEVIQAGYQSQYIKALLWENLDTADPVHLGFVRPDNKAGRVGVGRIRDQMAASISAFSVSPLSVVDGLDEEEDAGIGEG
jgi:hypothetical protein